MRLIVPKISTAHVVEHKMSKLRTDARIPTNARLQSEMLKDAEQDNMCPACGIHVGIQCLQVLKDLHKSKCKSVRFWHWKDRG